MKKLRYLVEALGLYILMFLLGIMPLDWASALGGWVGRSLGPRMAASRKAIHNMREAMPDLPEGDYKKMVSGMWDNLGRVMAEYPHLKKIGKERVKIKNAEIVEQLFDNDKACMMISAHMSNWEICSTSMLAQYNKHIDVTYRAPNNPWADRILTQARSLGDEIRAHSKSRKGGQSLIKSMKEGRYIGMLIDQKYNEGVAVSFFGKPAMTNPVFVQLCQKYNYPLIPIQAERIKGANFTMTIHKPLELFDSSGKALPVEEIIAEAHNIMEHWIRGRPEQWLWLHRRWDSQKLKDIKEAA